MAYYKPADTISSMPVCKICGFEKTVLEHKKNKFSYYRCGNCQTLFISPTPSVKSLEMYYQKTFTYTAGIAGEKKIGTMAATIMDNLMSLNKNGQSLLDIGSGYGVFLGEAKKYIKNVTGLEPSKSLYNYSKSYIRKHMMNINFDGFLRYNRQKYDFITLIHVIEHLPDPKKVLGQIISLLKPNGILYIETPNIDSYLYYSEKENYTFLTPPDHVWLFSQKSFKKLLKGVRDVKIEKLSTYSHPEHLMGFLKSIFHPKGGQVQKLQPNLFHPKDDNDSEKINKMKSAKYYLFDKILSPIFTPLLNIGNKGSILEMYLRKNNK